MNLFENIFGHGDRKPVRVITDPRSRERELCAALQAIDLDDPRRMLSNEKLRELNISGVIQYGCEDLRYPDVIDRNIAELDRDLEFIIISLGKAVREGWELTAEWAAKSLTFAIKNLKTDAEGLDEECARDMMKCQLEYSQNLKLLVELCMEHDNLSIGLERRMKNRQEKRQQLDAAKHRYMMRRDSGELNGLLEELSGHIHDPGGIRDEVRELREELSLLHRLKAAIIEIDIAMDTDKVTLNNREAQIGTRLNAMTEPPRARDPRLQERINEADRIYRERLRRELNEAEEMLRLYNRHVEGMSELADHGAQLALVSQAIEERERLQVRIGRLNGTERL